MTAVLLVHDGAEWLPECLQALASQTRPPERLVAADTTSRDGSASLVVAEYGEAAVVPLPRDAAVGVAVQAALDAFPSPPAAARPAAGTRGVPPAEHEWLWLLHDDCAPEPDALAELLAAATRSPDSWVVGPKVRSWDGERLLEAGITVDGSGQVETGLEGDELDQGQLDDERRVLAVGTAGALVRRDAWDRLGGIDRRWGFFGDDVDLGWRVNSAGGTVTVAPRAVVRHVAALTAGRRRAVGRRSDPLVIRRRNDMRVLLANTTAARLPLVVPRLLVGGLLRAAALLLLARDGRRAAAELAALFAVLARPDVLVAARRDRRPHRTVGHGQLRHLFPSADAGLRRSGSLVRLLRSRDTTVAGPGEQRAGGRRQVVETGPVAEDMEDFGDGDDGLRDVIRRPVVALVAGMTLLALVADRHLLGGVLHGGRLLPAPAGASDLWSTYVAGWHPVSVGSTTAAPPWIAVLAIVSTVLFGKVWLAVDILLLGAVPLAALSAWTALRAVTPEIRVRLWVAVAYGLLPAVTGAVAGGRLDAAVVAVLLPQLLRAAASVLAPTDLRSGPPWHRVAGTGLLLTLVAVWSPLVWLLAVPALLAAAVLIGATSSAGTDRRVAIAPRLLAALAVLAVTPVMTLDWLPSLVAHPGLLVSGTGLPDGYAATHPPSGLSLLLLRAGGAAQPPVWIGVPLLGAALLGLRRTTQVFVSRSGAGLLALGVAAAVVITRSSGATATVPASRHWPGVALLVAGAGALLCATVALTDARRALRGQSFGWRQLSAVVLAVLGLVATADLLGGWVVRGSAGPLRAGDPAVVPLFARTELGRAGSPRALVLQRSGGVVSYALVRAAAGPRLGDADVTSLAASGPTSVADRRLGTAVQDLAGGRPGAGAELAPLGIGFLVVPAASAPALAPALSRTSSLSVVPAPGASVWRSAVPAGELTVLAPGDAATALAGGSPTGAATVLPASAGSARTTLGPGPTGRLLVLAEPADSHWHAELDGHPLLRRNAYGWAQGFVLPTGGGTLRVRYDSGTRDVTLALQLAWFVVVGLLAVPPRRPTPVGSRR